MKPKIIKAVKPAPLCNKMFFIGIALGDSTMSETGIAVLDRNLNLIRVEKFFSNNELEFFFKTFNSTKDSITCLSLAPNPLHLSSRWRQDEKNIHVFQLYESAEDMLWTGRFSDRGNELYSNLNTLGFPAFRFNIHLCKLRLNLIPPFKMRSQPGCKYLQTSIKDQLSVNNLPNNLLPISVLDAIIGAYSGWKAATGKEDIDYTFSTPYKSQKVIVPLKSNFRPLDNQEVKKKKKKK